MRLCVAALCALLAVAAAQPDTEDLPPVDEITQKLNSHEMSPQELLNMMPSMPEQYVADVKHGLSDELKQEVKEQIHASRAAVEPEPEPEPEPAQEPSADDEDSTYDYDDDFLEDDEETEDDTEDADQEAAPEVAAEEAPVMLRASAPGLRADPVEEGSSGGGGSGSSSGGSGGVAEGGVLPALGSKEPLDNVKAARLLLEYSQLEQKACSARYKDAYNFYITDHTLGPNKVISETAYLKLWREFSDNSTQYDLSGIDNPDLVAALMMLGNGGPAALSDSQLSELGTSLTNLETKFATPKVCDFYDTNKCDLKLYQDIRVKLASSTDRDELAHYWLNFRSAVGRNAAPLYAKYVSLLDAAAKSKKSDADAWSLMLYPYQHGGMGSIVSLLEQMWEQHISPLYEHLHSYARLRLRQRYGAAVVPAEGPIPAHLFGSHEADDWSALEPLMRPIDNASSLDFHDQCKRQNIDVGRLKTEAATLYSGVGLEESTYTELSASRLNVAAADTDSVLFLPRVLDGCHSSSRSAVGIYPTNTTLSDYVELIELFATMQRYRERAAALLADNVGFPYKERLGYNDYGLDLAIGGARALAAISPEGLKQKLGFQIFESNEQTTLNFQMAETLKLLPRLAASMAALRWQSEVMSGAIPESQYNAKWWEFKREYQGVTPPEGHGGDQFDALADGTLTLPNYHIRRLIGGIAMFSVHKHYCTMLGDSAKPLSECAILESAKMGEDFRSVLVSGNAKKLRDQLHMLTGQQQLSATALVERMQPLADWMATYNQEHGDESGSGVGGSTEMIAIIVGVVIAVIVLGLVIFFVVARRKQKYQDYKGAPTRETATTQNA